MFKSMLVKYLPAKWGRSEQGNVFVETALVLPVLLMLTLGVADIGRGFTTFISMTNAARETARSISVKPDQKSQAQLRGALEASNAPIDGGYAITILPEKAKYAAGEMVTVQVHYDYPLMFNVIPGGATIPFNISATMRVMYDTDAANYQYLLGG